MLIYITMCKRTRYITIMYIILLCLLLFIFFFLLHACGFCLESSSSRNKTFLHYTHTFTDIRRGEYNIIIYIHAYSPHRGRQRQYIIIYRYPTEAACSRVLDLFLPLLLQRLASTYIILLLYVLADRRRITLSAGRPTDTAIT